VCYCEALPQIDTRTRVVILQHPRERDMPIGTARMATLALTNASLRVGMQWTADNLGDVVGDPARPAILLSPGPDARDILREPPAGAVTLVVVDGTWSQAKSLIRRNPFLQTLPRYAFDTPEPSQYRIRREPRPEYTSTIEALMHALAALEGNPGLRALLDPLRTMVDRQLACEANATKRLSYRRPRDMPREPRAPKIPAEVAERFGDLVCVVGEANAWPYTNGGERADELVHWVAHRPATGETFERIAAPTGELSPTTSFHTELDTDRLHAGVTRPELVDDLARFMRPNDIVCSWGHYSRDLLVHNGGPRFAAAIDLRAAAQRFANKRIGTLEQFAARLSTAPPPRLGLGRAGRRVALLSQIVRYWSSRPELGQT
jgi:DTW domain-containing protein YfiP